MENYFVCSLNCTQCDPLHSPLFIPILNSQFFALRSPTFSLHSLTLMKSLFSTSSTISSSSSISTNKFLARLIQKTPILQDASLSRCYNCGTVGHRSSECTATSIRKACFNCGSAGHISRECKEILKPVYCFRCRTAGHYSNECQEKVADWTVGLH